MCLWLSYSFAFGREQSLAIGRFNVVVSVLIVTTRIFPSVPGCVASTLQIRQRVGSICSSGRITSCPILIWEFEVSHFGRCWSRARYSDFHFFQKSYCVMAITRVRVEEISSRESDPSKSADFVLVLLMKRRQYAVTRRSRCNVENLMRSSLFAKAVTWMQSWKMFVMGAMNSFLVFETSEAFISIFLVGLLNGGYAFSSNVCRNSGPCHHWHFKYRFQTTVV